MGSGVSTVSCLGATGTDLNIIQYFLFDQIGEAGGVLKFAANYNVAFENISF